MTTKAEQVISEVLRLDGEATPAPWNKDNDADEDNFEYNVWQDKGYWNTEYLAKVDHGLNAKLITEYRTSAPKLAKALAVAIAKLKQVHLQTYVTVGDAYRESQECGQALSQINQIFGGEDAPL